MSLFTEITVLEKDYEVVVIEGAGEEAKVIFADTLTTEDKKVFAAIAEEDGATFKEKFDAFLIKGVPASEFYKKLIWGVADYERVQLQRKAKTLRFSEIAELLKAGSESPAPVEPDEPETPDVPDEPEEPTDPEDPEEPTGP